MTGLKWVWARRAVVTQYRRTARAAQRAVERGARR